MEKKWTFCAVYSIIQIHFVRGVWEEIVNTREDVYALPGSDVELTCHIQKKDFLVQMQWSKVTDKVDMIAIYHPQHGFYCAHGIPCESLVAFTEAPGKVTNWTLFLRNVSSSVGGNYECSFTMFPEGIQTKTYNLLVQRHVTQDKWRSNHTIETEMNQTLKIPCFQNSSAEISSEFTVAWLVEVNGTQETLASQKHINKSVIFKDRVKIDSHHGLHLSPVQIQDDGLKFSCCVKGRYGEILRSSTTVKVFAKPETPMIMENNSMGFLGERTFTCSLKNVFPKANLTWFIDERSLQDGNEGIHITNEERKGKGGFLELKSVLTSVRGNQLAQSNNLTIWCVALSPVPGNKVWTISEKITISWVGYPATSSMTPMDMPSSTTSQTSNSHVATQDISYSRTSSGIEAGKSISWTSSETYSSSSSNTGSTLHGDVFTSTSRTFSEVPTTARGSTKNNRIYITGIELGRPEDGISWPVIVAFLLFFCVILFGLGIRKWCQYQKEIMERPPPFKPPPPPIKYTCIQEPIGSDLPYQEMETL
nr:T-cell surface protein tactile isoform X3 [Oryctolagus cuniculus]